LQQSLGLEPEALLVLVLAGLVEEDIRFGTLFATLQDPLPARRPCHGLLEGLLGADAGARECTWDVVGRLLEHGLLLTDDGRLPRAEWVLRVPPVLWSALRGSVPHRPWPGAELHPRRAFLPLKALILPATLRPRLLALPRVLAEGGLDALLLRGMAGSGRRTVLGALARAMRRDLLWLDRRRDALPVQLPPEFGALATLTGALPAIALDPAPGQAVELPRLEGYRGSLAISLRREGSATGPGLERALVLELPFPGLAERARIWADLVGPEAAPTLAGQVLLPLGTTRRAAAVARAHARIERRAVPGPADVAAACRTLGREALDTLAQRLEPRGNWAELVVEEGTREDLGDLASRCRNREQLPEAGGPALRGATTRGVRALFNGPSGTGKSLAARILAGGLGKDLYRLDLAAVVNKYIGETEKNLSQLLARTEELDVVLLVDEGDALLGPRTEVKSANDRYANLETNYLLQRMETYEGIVLITTNASSRIDQAFQRRFDVVVEFLPPDAAQRRAIWALHLPEEHAVSATCLAEVARRCALTGGQIRNAALHAAATALELGGAAIGDALLEAAVRREYRKSGAACPLAARATWPPRRGSARLLVGLD
jgi:hypothetical protein